MSYDAYRFFPSSGITHQHSTMFPPEQPYTREPAYPGDHVSMKGRNAYSNGRKATIRTQQVDKLTNTAKECLLCIKRGHINRKAVHACLPHRTIDAVGSGIRCLTVHGYIKSIRVGKNGNAYQIMREEIEA